MMRFSALVGWVVTGVVLAGCSTGSRVDLAQFQRQRLAKQEEPRLAQRTYGPSRRSATLTARARATQEPVETTGSAGRADDAKPWPKRGTPEWDQVQADEAATERRVEQAIRSICRGC